ncbi:hypothetical protein [Vallitalea sp.]|jgi:hypothetical protein|uniref:hypothetical protein n=1 Tax=Vallitalea sp. TaxID=1882829 RepID=UPI0025EE1CB2|nr:hypothetical protein [Vallitalea sp.]MCT4688519.1 hypothetical protein [Vallitalea sp.]
MKKWNLMVQGGSGTNVTSKQRLRMLKAKVNLEPNTYTNPFTGKKSPYPYLHYYNRAKVQYEKTHVSSVGLKTRKN